MTPADLRTVGEVLHGPRWQRALAVDLGVAYRTMLRWAAGERVAPERLRGELVDLIEARIEALQAVLAELSRR